MASGVAARAAAAVRVATFNASLTRGRPGDLLQDLRWGGDRQIHRVAEIIQRVRPDLLLLNEVDYVAGGRALAALQRNYLDVPHQDARALHLPYRFVAPSNTGVDSGLDLDGDGRLGGPGDALGYGAFPGQYAMALLSRYPLAVAGARTFRSLPWRDILDGLLPVAEGDGPWGSGCAQAILPVSSKSHWDVPVSIGGRYLHLLCSHPTPPVFDGPRAVNARRNHDEIRLWMDYLRPGAARYIVDDQGRPGGLESGARFVILGDLNASPVEGTSMPGAIEQLLGHEAVDARVVPESPGGAENDPGNPYARYHTADWRMRVDYVLPSSRGWAIVGGGVFWPSRSEPLAHLVAPGPASSDHRLVYLDLVLQ